MPENIEVHNPLKFQKLLASPLLPFPGAESLGRGASFTVTRYLGLPRVGLGQVSCPDSAKPMSSNWLRRARSRFPGITSQSRPSGLEEARLDVVRQCDRQDLA